IYGIQIRDNGLTDLLIKNNVIYGSAYGIGYGASSSDTALRWRAYGNKVIAPTVADFRYLIENTGSSNEFGEGILDLGITGPVRDSASGRDANDLTPNSVEVLSNQLANV